MDRKRSDLNRYLDAQNASYDGYEQALEEIRRGRKVSHWIWYIFPQIKGLGHSGMSQYYGIGSLEEAKQRLLERIALAEREKAEGGYTDGPAAMAELRERYGL